MNIPVNRILPNPQQPRQVFDKDELDALATSIAENGVIQPIVVEEASDGYYILHDGERRLRASILAGKSEIPAAITPPLNGEGPKERLIRALVANVQRSNLTPVEEARAYRDLRQVHGMTIAQIARKMGKAYQLVYIRLQMLDLEEGILALIDAGKLPSSPQAVKAFLTIPEGELRLKFARQASVRKSSIAAIAGAAEKLVSSLQTQAPEDPQDQRAPAISAALRTGKLPKKQWDAMMQIGQVPPWPVVEESIASVCSACVLQSAADFSVCRDCPLPSAIEKMISAVVKVG